MGQRADGLAARFETAVKDFAQAVQSCPDGKWNATCEAPWTVAQVAQHVAGQFPLESEFLFASAEGRDLPAYTMADVNQKNDARAAAEKAVTKDHVLKTLHDGTPPLASWIRGLSDEQLDHGAPLGLAGGANVTLQQLLEGGVLIDHVAGAHLQSIKAAIAS
jgi:hypothetical protein